MRTHRFDTDGFYTLPEILNSADCAAISSSLDALRLNGIASRNLLDLDWCKALGKTLRQHPAIAPLLPFDSASVQCTLFEKSQDRNWLVPLHQDLSIPVHERIAGADLKGWSEKNGVM